jgi:hypothetical protein
MEVIMGEFFLKLLDWPFLLFLGIGILLYKFKDEFKKILSRGGITLTWGDKSFEISELPEQLNETFAPVTDDIEDLKARIEEIEKITQKSKSEIRKDDSKDLTSEQIESARRRMLEGLESGKYTWRSIERLATIGNISETQASNILRPMNEVIFSRGKSGRTIVKLTSR